MSGKTFVCQECKEEGKHVIHISFFTDVDGPDARPNDDSLWGWAVMNHDGTTRQEWSSMSFVSEQAARDHLNRLIGYTV